RNKEMEKLRVQLEKAQAQAATNVVSILDYDQPKGMIHSIDRAGEMPFINLGSADNARPGLTFSVYGINAEGKPISHEVTDRQGKPAVGTDAKPLREGKATVEVVSVLSDHVSQARITSWRDRERDPVLKGDLLFNPAWSPNMRQHVAIAGTVDLTGEGHDDLQELIRTLERQNVIVDAYLDTK